MVMGLGDALIMLPLVVWLFFPNWYTFIAVIALIVVIRITQYKGMSLTGFLRFIRSTLAGSNKPNRSNIYKRMMISKPGASNLYKDR